MAERRTSGVLARIFGGLSGEERRAAETELETATSAEVAEREAELRRQLAVERRRRFTAEASTFVDLAVREERCLPAERASLVAQLVQAAEDDERDPRRVELAEGELKFEAASRVAALRAQVDGRPKHGMLGERVEVEGRASELRQGGESQTDDLDRVEARTREWVERQGVAKESNGRAHGASAR